MLHGQKIEEEFRIDKIKDIEGKVKEINSAYKDLTKSIDKNKKGIKSLQTPPKRSPN